MDVRDSPVARAVVDLVAAHDGEYTWYDIVKTVDQYGLDKDPPTMFWLRELVRADYVVRDRPGNTNDARHVLTPRGRRLADRDRGAR